MEKFLSRKLFMAIAGLVVAVLVVLGKITPDNVDSSVQLIVGAAIAVFSLFGYQISQGSVDKASAGKTSGNKLLTGVQNLAEALKPPNDPPVKPSGKIFRSLMLGLSLPAALFFAGCTVKGADRAIDAAHQGVIADEKIIDVYHAAVMRNFEMLKESTKQRTADLVDRASAQNKLTAPLVKEGIDALLAKLAEIEDNRQTFVELYAKAKQNTTNTKESLRLANDLVIRAQQQQNQIQDSLNKLWEKYKPLK